MEVLKIVTPVYEYLNQRSSLNFIRLINYLGSDEAAISNADFVELVRQSKNPVEIVHSNLFEFDNEFWEAIANYDINIKWSKYIKEENEELNDSVENLESNQENLKIGRLELEITRQSLIAAVSDQKKENESSEDSLHYFSSVNEIIEGNKEFSRFVQMSNELSTLLVNLAITDKEDQDQKVFDDKNWEWMFPNLCSYYNSYLNENILTEVNKNYFDKNKRASVEVYCFSNLLILSLVLIHINGDEVSTLAALRELLNISNFLKKDNKIVAALLALAPLEAKTSKSGASGFKVELIVGISCMVVKLIDASSYANSNVSNLLVRAYLKQVVNDDYSGLKIDNDLIEEIICGPIEAIIEKFESNYNNLVENELRNKFNIFKNGVKVKDVKDYLNYYSKVGVDEGFYKIIYNNLHWDYFHFNADLRRSLVGMSEFFVSQLNLKKDKSNLQINSGLVPQRNALNACRSYPAFYENFSTLAIPLAEDEVYYDSFYETNPSNRFVTGAKTIFEAGFLDHSLVFLGYGLTRLSLGLVPGHNNFSVSLVDKFIGDPKVWPRVEKSLLPFLDLIMELNPSVGRINYECLIWIKSIQARFNGANLRLIDFTKIREFHEAKGEHTFPVWFSKDEAELEKAIDDFKKLPKIFEISIWPSFYKNKNIRAVLNEIAQSLEYVVLEMFRPIFNIFYNEDKIRNDFRNLTSSRQDNSFDRRIDLGWVEFFIRQLIYAQQQKPKELKNVIDQIKKCDGELGRPLYRLQSLSLTTFDSFVHFRKLRNSLSHKEGKGFEYNVLQLNDCNWLFDYATRDFIMIFKCFEK